MLDPSNPDALVEHVFGELPGGHREVLPETGQICEAKIYCPNRLFLDQ